MNDSADRKIILTVCVAVYNICDEFLRSCIESLISDKYENVEILLGDDGSRRQTADICGICKKRFKSKAHPQGSKQRRKRDAQYYDSIGAR